MTRFITMLAVLALSGACFAQAEAEKPEPKPLWADDFEAYEPADKWTGGDVWQVGIPDGFVGHFAIGADYGKDGKGLLLLNENEKQAGKRLVWMTALHAIPELQGKDRFVISLDYQVPTKEDKDIHRVDFVVGETGPGAVSMFSVELASWGVTGIYRDADKEGTRKMAYVRVDGNPAGQWNHVELQVDQAADRWRVLLNGKPGTCAEGEWCYLRYDHDASAERAKTISFSTADGWKGARRFIDNIAVTEPTEAWEIK